MHYCSILKQFMEVCAYEILQSDHDFTGGRLGIRPLTQKIQVNDALW